MTPPQPTGQRIKIAIVSIIHHLTIKVFARWITIATSDRGAIKCWNRVYMRSRHPDRPKWRNPIAKDVSRRAQEPLRRKRPRLTNRCDDDEHFAFIKKATTNIVCWWDASSLVYDEILVSIAVLSDNLESSSLWCMLICVCWLQCINKGWGGGVDEKATLPNYS